MILFWFFCNTQNLYSQEIKITYIKVPASVHDTSKYELLKPSSLPIDINYSQNSFFVFFNPPYKNGQYSYRVKKLNRYELPSINNLIFLANVPNGSYELVIKDLRHPEVKPAIQKFIIEPPIWLRWWFLPLMFLYAIILIGTLAYFLSLYRLRQQLRLQSVRHELEIKALRAQMNPHFIFNCMNTIDAYILRKKFLEASDYLQKFSKLIRKILENSESQTISIEQEIQTLKLYISLEQERFSHSFVSYFEIEPDLMENDYQIPSLVLQPFVENAILHGIRHLTERKGLISVILKKIKGSSDEDILLCIIQDNGVGRKASSVINEQRQASHKSMGVNVTLERINTYQAIYGNKMETVVSDLEDGTKVEIKLPLFMS
jgi:hypothetical protein